MLIISLLITCTTIDAQTALINKLHCETEGWIHSKKLVDSFEHSLWMLKRMCSTLFLGSDLWYNFLFLNVLVVMGRLMAFFASWMETILDLLTLAILVMISLWAVSVLSGCMSSVPLLLVSGCADPICSVKRHWNLVKVNYQFFVKFNMVSELSRGYGLQTKYCIYQGMSV